MSNPFDMQDLFSAAPVVAFSFNASPTKFTFGAPGAVGTAGAPGAVGTAGAPGWRSSSLLSDIAKRGLVPLFEFWVQKYETERPLAERPAKEWASSKVLSKYVQSIIPQAELKKKEIMMPEQDVYRFDWNTISLLHTALEEASGVVYISFTELKCQGQAQEKTLIVHFMDKERVTVMTICEKPEIRCEEFERAVWTRTVMEGIINQDPKAFARANLLHPREFNESEKLRLSRVVILD